VIEEQQRRFTYWDFAVVFFAGLFVSLIVTIGAMMWMTISSGALPDVVAGVPARIVFWVVLPAQILGQLLALAWISHRHGTGKFSTDFGLALRTRDSWFLIVGGVLLLGLGLALKPLADALGVNQNPQDIVQAVAEISDPASRVVVFLGVVVLSPLVEELWFRGLLLRTLRQREFTPTASVLIQGMVFALFHLLDGGALAGALVVIPELFVVGSFLGYLAVRSGKLSQSFFTHAGFNLVTTLALFYMPGLGI
jgi:membrane protease YdiL (CAAX protease family)